MPNIFNIKSNYKFLDCLAQWILCKYSNDSITLSNILLLLPSKRACREMKKIFLENSTQESAILPKIKAIGSVDYDDLIVDFNIDIEELEKITKPLRPIKYKLLLIKEIKKWLSETGNLHDSADFSQILNLAYELEDFLSDVTKEGLELEKLNELAEKSEVAQHWEQILAFLRIFGQRWKNILKSQNIISTNEYRMQMLAFNRKYLENNPPKYPIIIAGSTGSIPETAKLIKTISQFDNCSIIFNGLDKSIEEKSWNEIDEFHPQFLLKKLVEHLEISRDEVEDISKSPQLNANKLILTKKSSDSREKLLNKSTLPASQTYEWLNINKEEYGDSPLQNIALLEAKNESEEADTISLLVRKFLEQEQNQKKLAIITKNPSLIKEIRNRLLKYGINIDDSIGIQLSNHKIIDYIGIVSRYLSNEFSIKNLISILKHPVTSIGHTKEELNSIVGKFEYIIRKREKKFFSLDEYVDYFKHSQDDFTGIIGLLDRFKNITSAKKAGSGNDFFNSSESTLSELTEKYISIIEGLATTNASDGGSILWNDLDESGDVYKFITELVMQGGEFYIDEQNYLLLVKTLASNRSVKNEDETHPRLHIIPFVEARLIDFDYVIIPQMNEGDIPSQIRTDPWMNRSMRERFGLPKKERQVGVSAYDFVNITCCPNVYLTRSQTKDGEPTNKSRFLLRLEAVAKILTDRDITKPNEISLFLKMYNNIDSLEIIPESDPKPPLEYRPKELAATTVEKLLNNPYQIYAKKILNLSKLEDVDKEPSFKEFGSTVHETIEDFLNHYDYINESDKLNTFCEYGEKRFDKYFTTETSKKSFWPRFKNIAKWFVKNEEDIRKKGYKILSEMKVKHQIGELTITAKIDRLQIDRDGNVDIIDYKTGNIPSENDVKSGKKPQLTIEGVILTENKEVIGEHLNSINKLEYWETKGNRENCKITRIPKKSDPISTKDLINDAKQGLINVVNYFSDVNNGYFIAEKDIDYDDYKHLERKGE